MGFVAGNVPNPTYERISSVLGDEADVPETEREAKPTIGETFGAAFRTENVVGSYLAKEDFDRSGHLDPTYDALSPENLKGYEAHAKRFVNVFSPAQNEALKRQIDRETEDRKIIARAGAGGFAAALVAGTVDPTIFIPVGGTVKKGESLLTIGAKSAYGAMAGATASELLLHATQETRTAGESGMAIGGAAFLGGVLGPAIVGGYRGVTGKPIGGFDSAEFDALSRRVEREAVYDPQGDFNLPDPAVLARLREEVSATSDLSPDVTAAQSEMLAAMVTTFARRQGRDPMEFYEAEGFRLRRGVEGEAQALEQAARVGYEGGDRGEAQEWLAAKAKGLDVSQEARMQRAREMGFDTETVLYHGTNRKSKSFDGEFKEFVPGRRTNELGTYFAKDPSFADEFAGNLDYTGSRVIPAYARGEMLDLTDFGAWVDESNIDELAALLGDEVREAAGDIMSRVSNGLDSIALFNILEHDAMVEKLRNSSFDGIDFMDLRNGGQDWNRVIFDPSNIRSVNAAFDPDMSDSANLLFQMEAEPLTEGAGLAAIRVDEMGFTNSAEQALFDPPPRFRDARNLTADQWRKYFKEAGATGEAFTHIIEPALKTLTNKGDISKADLVKAVRSQRPLVELSKAYETNYQSYVTRGDHTNYRQDVIVMPRSAAGYMSHNWRSAGVVGHIRTTDRTSLNGEPLRFVDELQSDLHQEGAKFGYVGEARKRAVEFESLRQDAVEKGERFAAYMRENYPDDVAWHNIGDGIMREEGELDDFSGGGVSGAFDKTAEELLNTWWVASDLYEGTKLREGVGIPQPPRAPVQDWEKPWIRRVIQQAIADGKELVAFTSYKTLHHALRNEGTRKFYDERLPTHIKKVAKEIGAKIERVEMDIGPPQTVRVLALRITPEAKAKMAKGNVLFQEPGKKRGQYDLGTKTIDLFQSSDPSTLMHEASHWYLDALFRMRGGEFVDKQLDDILRWHGTRADEVFDDAGDLTRRGVELQEAFAETFEVYLQTGKAPVPRLQAVFDQFREWLTALYKSLDPRKRANLTPEIKQVFDRMLAYETGGMEQLNLEAMRSPQSVGAAAIQEPTLEDYEIAKSFGTADVSAVLRLNPLLRTATADSAVVREVGAKLMENALYLKSNLEGQASAQSVEQNLTQYRGWHAKAESDAHKAYLAHRRDKSEPNMTERAFYERVAYAMRRGDVDSSPHVAAAAKAYRVATDKVKDRAIAAGLLPEDVKVTTADSYFHRMWNRQALKRRPTEFRAMTKAWLSQTFDAMLARATQLRFELDKIDAKPADADKAFLAEVEELERLAETEGGLSDFAEQVANNIFDALVGHDARLIDTGFSLVPGARGPLKERTFNIPDLYRFGDVGVEDYLVNDAQEVMSRYMRVMSVDIELAQTFGSPDLAEPIAKIREDYRKLIDRADNQGEKKRLTNQMQNRINDINGVRDVMRGNYGPDNYDNMFARGAAMVRSLNFTTMLGGMTVSAFPDVANKVLLHGYVGLTRDLLAPLLLDVKGIKGAAREAKELGIAVELALATRIASLADVGDMYGRGTRFERFVNGLSNRFSHLTLMRHWNDVMKSADYIAATNRAIRVMERPARAGKATKAWLANLGIGEAEYERILAQYKAHGEKRLTMRLAHVDKWTDEEARRIWVAAMGKNANLQTVTPGAGDKLLVMNGDLGKTIGQFKSFAMAANQRVMIRGAQTARMGDARFVSGVSTFIGLGMLVYYLNMIISGRKPSDDPTTWVREGVDRSGIIPVLMEAFNTAEKVTGTTLVGESPASRYASRGAFASLLGPSVGRSEDFVSLVQGAFDGQLKDRDIHAVRKLLPFNNIFYIRGVLDRFEMAAVEQLDAEKTSLSDRRESVLNE